MKQLNWYQIFGQTHTIPEGSTAVPTDDVQILLNCANIWNKAYTTIAELLADTSSLLVVINDNNAIDYLVRSTTFASTVASDSTAMTDIGLNNYCANTLLADSTWREAICNSEYFESVLNVKVPTMTSDTTPSGKVIYDSHGWTASWGAFDGSNENYNWWLSVHGQYNGAYCGYVFPEEVLIVKATITQAKYTREGSQETAVWQTSEDGVTWNNISDVFAFFQKNTSPITYDFILSNQNANRYYRLYYLSGAYDANTNQPIIGEMQFYGREDV